MVPNLKAMGKIQFAAQFPRQTQSGPVGGMTQLCYLFCRAIS